MQELKERFDKAENYHKIVAEIEQLEHEKSRIKMRYSLVPIGIIAVVLAVMLWSGNGNPSTIYLANHDYGYENQVEAISPTDNMPVETVDNIIVINEVTDKSGSARLMVEAVDGNIFFTEYIKYKGILLS